MSGTNSYRGFYIGPFRQKPVTRDQPAGTPHVVQQIDRIDFDAFFKSLKEVVEEWGTTHEISSVKVYWFDDTGRGECRLPKSWRVLYKDASGEFQPVNNLGPYKSAKDTFNKVEFAPVDTSAVKLEITLQDEWAAGIQEVVIE